MSDYTIHVTDERWRPLNGEMIRWELDGFRKVRVSAQFGDDTTFRLSEARPWVSVLICENDEWESPMAVIALPDNGPFGGIKTEFVPALQDVIRQAEQIANQANERIRAAVAEFGSVAAAEAAR